MPSGGGYMLQTPCLMMDLPILAVQNAHILLRAGGLRPHLKSAPKGGIKNPC